MSKKIAFLMVFFLGSLFVILPFAQALEIEVDQSGTMRFYDDYVLGETTDNMVRQRAPQRIVPRSDSKELSVQATGKMTNIELRRRGGETAPDGTTRFKPVEKVKADNLKVRFPSKENDGSEEDGSRNQYMERLKAERKERIEEMTELRNREKGDKQSLELKSRNVRADINGAQFTLDPVTNEVLLTTPSGNQHILKHLPDQALARMKEVGLITTASATDENALETEITDEGVTYKAKVRSKKRLFGLFRREVDAEIVLDDETGEVTEEVLPSEGLFGGLLDAVTF